MASRYQFERERAQHIDSMRFVSRRKARRRAEQLRAIARQKERYAAGAGLDAHNERFADPAPYVEPKDSNLSVILWWVGFIVYYVGIGPARLLGWFIYRRMVRRVPARSNRVPLRHLLGIGALAALLWLPLAAALGLFWGWIFAQFAFAPICAAVHGYMWGWGCCINNLPPQPDRPHQAPPQQANQAIYDTFPPVAREVEPPAPGGIIGDFGIPAAQRDPALPAIPDHLLIRPHKEES